MINNTSILERFIKSYDSMVRIFAYTVGELSQSLPKSDYSCKSAIELLPAANQLLSTTQQYNGSEKFSALETSDLLDELITSDTPIFESIQRLGLLPLIQKIKMYRSLILSIKPDC